MTISEEFTYSQRFPDIPFVAATFATKSEDLIPLSFGSPAKESFKLEVLEKAAVAATRIGGITSLEYEGGVGKDRLVDWIRQRSLLRSIQAESKEIVVTAGSTQAIEVATKAVTDKGDHVWVEAPSFFGAIRHFLLSETELTAFPVDEDGLQVDVVEESLKAARTNGTPLPKMLYVMPNYHNPTGVRLSLERRKKLAELAYEYNFYVLEDDAYVELAFHGEYMPSIYSFGPERVIYVSTFSKIIAPGIRLGWAVAGEEVVEKMKVLKSDGQTSVYVQEIAAHYLDIIDFDKHVQFLISTYQSRMESMVSAIDEYFGNEVTYMKPDGGYFVWLTFPEDSDTNAFIEQAHINGVSYLNGSLFYLHQEEKNHLRLSFSYCDEADIKKGIQRLAESYYTYRENSLVSKAATDSTFSK